MTQLALPIKFKIKDTDDFKKNLLEYFREHRRLKPVRFGFTVEYAESLEYGTGPLSQFQPTVHGGAYTYKTIYNEIYAWAGKKDGNGLPIKNEEERREFAKTITKKFFTLGMKPHPYWRPAINYLEANEQRWFDEGKSLMEMADEAMRIANKCIMEQNLPFSGKLKQSAILEEIDPREFKDTKMCKDYNDDERNALYSKSAWG